jgi:hypothetical protein
MRAGGRGCSCMTTASIVITRASSSESNVYVLRINDDMSGVVVCEIHMTAEQFAAALTAQHVAGIPVEWPGAGLIGKVREVKQELVFVRTGSDATEKERVVAAIAAYEVDGWRGRAADATNHHRHRGGGRYDVTFTRFVDPVG